MKKIITLFVIVSLFAGLSIRANAQRKDNKGTDFWFVFPSDARGPTTQFFLIITGVESTTVTVSIPALGVTIPFAVTAGADTALLLPSNTFNSGIHVTTAREVTVYGHHSQRDASEGFLALPT